MNTETKAADAALIEMFARRLEANADYAERAHYSVCNLSTLKVEEARRLANILRRTLRMGEQNTRVLAGDTDALLSRCGNSLGSEPVEQVNQVVGVVEIQTLKPDAVDLSNVAVSIHDGPTERVADHLVGHGGAPSDEATIALNALAQHLADWEPTTSRGRVAKADLLADFDRMLARAAIATKDNEEGQP